MTWVQKIAVWALPVLFAVTLHEVAHGWVAKMLGDPTAAALGRLSLNPIKHIDPVGTILVPGVLLLVGGFLFGWAKPVPVDARHFKNPLRGMAIVAIAGPAANFVMAIGWAFLLRWGVAQNVDTGVVAGVVAMARAGVIINLVLMVLNLLPLPPLDGGRIVTGLLPPHAAYQFSRIEPYGFYILLGLMFTGILGTVMSGPLGMAQSVVFGFTGLFYQ